MSNQAQSDERRPLLEGDDGEGEAKGHFNLVGLSASAFWAMMMAAWISGIFLWFLDSTIVATLLSSISSDLHAANNASWLGASYLLSAACLSLVWGRLSNAFGRRSMLLVALFLFGMGTLGCAVSPTVAFMIASRAVAGAGAGGLAPLTTLVVTDTVPGDRRGLFNGYMNLVGGVGATLGPALGGLLNDTIGWRWAFASQIPFIAVGMIMLARFVRYENLPAFTSRMKDSPTGDQSVRKRLAGIDWLGTVLFASTLALFLIPVSLLASDTDTPHPLHWKDTKILGPVMGSVVTLGLFLLVETKMAPQPMLPMKLLANRTVACGALAILTAGISQYNTIFTIPLFLTVVRQLSSTQTGLRLLIPPAFQIIGTFASGIYIRKTGHFKTPAVLGAVLTTLSSVILSVFWDANSAEHWFWWSFPVMNAGLGLLITAVFVGITVSTGPANTALAVATIWTARNTGQVLGIALSGIILQSTLSVVLPKVITGGDKLSIIDEIRKSSASVTHLPPEQKAAAIAAYQLGLRRSYYVCIGLGVAAVLATLGLTNMNVKDVPKAAPAQAEEEED